MRTEFVAIWAVLFAAVLVAWVATRRTALAVRGLIGSIGARRAGRVALWLGWAWLGWHFLAR